MSTIKNGIYNHIYKTSSSNRRLKWDEGKIKEVMDLEDTKSDKWYELVNLYYTEVLP